jgi:ribosomal protein L37E
MKTEYDVVIVGAGLAGLTTAYYLKKLHPGLHLLVIERSGRAGGLSGDWVDHRFGPNKRLQPPMHMVFREKYPNLIRLVKEIGGSLSPVYTSYNIFTSDGKRHRLEMNDWTSRHLPPPFHGLGMFMKLSVPWLTKWDLFKMACVSTYCACELLPGAQEPGLIPNTLSLESLELLLDVGRYGRDFMESVTPSIYNLHPWYTNAPRMAAVMAGTMTMSRNSLHYHIFSKNYNAALIDRFVETLVSMGVEFRFWTEVRRIESNADGSQVDAIWCKTYGPDVGDAVRYICENCGAENYCLDRAFCTRCGLDTTLDKIREGKIKRPAGSELWMDPEGNGYEKIYSKTLVTAMYPHMIARLVPIESSLRKHPYVMSCFSSRARQTQLSIGRVYYRKQVARGESIISGTHNPYFCFNGCQYVYNNFGGQDLDYEGDVIDVLLDVGIIRDAHSHETQKERIVHDIQRVYPDADPSLVEHVSFANLYPDILYLTEQPAIAGLHRFFNTHRTGAKNWYVAGCHSGTIGIGMESAIEGAMRTVNSVLEDMGKAERVAVEPYYIHPGSRLASTFGKAILLWKTRGRSLHRLAGNKYSMPKR